MAGAEQGYCTRIRQALQDCAAELLQNCDQYTVKIKSLLGHINVGKLGVSQRQLYQQYDSRYDLFRQKMQAMAQELAQGQNIVGKWAAACVPGLERIRQKIQKKRILMIVAPLIFALIAIASFKFVTSLDFSKDTETVREETTGQGDAAEGFGAELGKAMAETVIDQVSDKVDTGMNEVKNIVIFLILFVYVFYAVFVIQRSKRWYCEAAGSYLAPEVEGFLEENTIAQEAEQKFEAVYSETESTYRNLIREMLRGSGFEGQTEVNNEAQQFQALLKEWENIRRLA